MKTVGRCMTIVTLLLAALTSCIEDTMKRQQLELRSRLERAIADTDLELDRLKRGAQEAADTTREKLNAQIERLEDARRDLSDNLDKVGDTTADEWDTFRRAIDRSLENTAEALKEAKEDIVSEK